jgi:Peptidase propeptide and YPEB domain
MRAIVVAALSVSMIVPGLAQTQPTRPSAYRTFPTMRSAWATAPVSPCYGRGRRYRWSSFNPTSPCYTGTPYLVYSAIEPFEFPNPTNRAALPGSASLDEEQAKLQIEAKGYLDVSNLEQDSRGIWRGNATMKDGRRVDVTLDLAGNIYSEWKSRLYIRIRPVRRPYPFNSD